jgi:hypothetical protein
MNTDNQPGGAGAGRQSFPQNSINDDGNLEAELVRVESIEVGAGDGVDSLAEPEGSYNGGQDDSIAIAVNTTPAAVGNTSQVSGAAATEDDSTTAEARLEAELGAVALGAGGAGSSGAARSLSGPSTMSADAKAAAWRKARRGAHARGMNNHPVSTFFILVFILGLMGLASWFFYQHMQAQAELGTAQQQLQQAQAAAARATATKAATAAPAPDTKEAKPAAVEYTKLPGWPVRYKASVAKLPAGQEFIFHYQVAADGQQQVQVTTAQLANTKLPQATPQASAANPYPCGAGAVGTIIMLSPAQRQQRLTQYKASPKDAAPYQDMKEVGGAFYGLLPAPASCVPDAAKHPAAAQDLQHARQALADLYKQFEQAPPAKQ